MPPREATSELRLGLALLAQLGAGRPRSTAALAKQLGVSEDEVERMATTLTMTGLPPYTPFDLIDIEIDEDSLSLRSAATDALRRPTRLTLAEAEALRAALELLKGQLDPESEKALASLCDKVGRSLASAATLQPQIAAVPGDESQEVLATLRRAAWGHRLLSIQHHSASAGRLRERIVEPWALLDRGGEWYLLGRAGDAGEPRTFRVDRIRAASVLVDSFAPPDPDVVARWVAEPFQLPDDRIALVRFSGEGARWARERWPECLDEAAQAGRRAAPRNAEPPGDAGDEVLVRLPYRDDGWVIRQLLPYLDDALVEGPPELAEAYAAYLEALLSRYGQG